MNSKSEDEARQQEQLSLQGMDPQRNLAGAEAPATKPKKTPWIVGRDPEEEAAIEAEAHLSDT